MSSSEDLVRHRIRSSPRNQYESWVKTPKDYAR
jgi:hypothetical protein